MPDIFADSMYGSVGQRCAEDGLDDQLGTILEDDMVLCTKRGVVMLGRKCRKFRYDPIKRVPSKTKAPDFSKYNKEDFTL